ncbi:hypothetical protein AeMF1_002551 [Aphanomyces euteiches]|nr:hypothetical protein AeMF1_002551 [Aphanomyces euteiches]KAH9192094.1 hypothetical protein AeNC1_005935 [Aphanomyces euteiches]
MPATSKLRRESPLSISARKPPGRYASMSSSSSSILSPPASSSRSHSLNNAKLHRSNSSPPKLSQVNHSSGGIPVSRVQTFVRLRPSKSAPSWLTCHSMRSGRVVVDVQHQKHAEKKQFVVDQVFPGGATQEQVFHDVGVSLVDNLVAGINGSLFAYGQSASGKTHTLLGELTRESDERGVVVRMLDLLFERLDETAADYDCRCSFVEIYHDKIFDLLDGHGVDPKPLREDTARQLVYVDGLTFKPVDSAVAAFDVLVAGVKTRKALGRVSSRSHTIFSVVLARKTGSLAGKRTTAVLHCVDLAGSEKPHALERANKDMMQINKSLSSLGNVIGALGDVSNGVKRHVPYRDCKLTFLLRDALGGNSTTTVLATVTAEDKWINETIATLQFAERVKHVTAPVAWNECEPSVELASVATTESWSEEDECQGEELTASSCGEWDGAVAVAATEEIETRQCEPVDTNQSEPHVHVGEVLAIDEKNTVSKLKEHTESMEEHDEECQGALGRSLLSRVVLRTVDAMPVKPTAKSAAAVILGETSQDREEGRSIDGMMEDELDQVLAIAGVLQRRRSPLPTSFHRQPVEKCDDSSTATEKRDSATQMDPLVDKPIDSPRDESHPNVRGLPIETAVALLAIGICVGGCAVGLVSYLRQQK